MVKDEELLELVEMGMEEGGREGGRDKRGREGDSYISRDSWQDVAHLFERLAGSFMLVFMTHLASSLRYRSTSCHVFFLLYESP